MSLLPAAFADLEPYAAKWCLGSEAERYAMRMASSMAEMNAFYDAVTPRAEAAIAWCDHHDLATMPHEAKNLMHLLYSMIMVSFPVECWGQARVPDSGAAAIDCRVEPGP